ncbi:MULTISPECIES: hypothetical protein [Streptomyces]|uniref:hypothetical protein n=1 Tax=Streptomyces TaxID=1883 RepID=UPI001982A4D4|nr:MULTISPECIES: hypothetical protein [Streptomyces]WTC47635.1 hypothetical protein OG855_07770 [Streptomyces anthocyanicus]GHA76384.1 hypothetical protein GCM10010391_72170 [Streptomyces anthocyanicus]
MTDEYLVGYEQILTEAASTGRRLTRDDLDSRRALGERAAEAGHGLRLLVSEHLAAALAIWPRFSSPTNSALAAVHQAIDAFAEGYERAQRLAVRQEEAARREFIDDLLHGRSDPGRLAERASRSRGHPGHHPVRTASRDGWRHRRGVRFVGEETASVAFGAMLTALRPGRTPPSATRDPQVLALRRVSERQERGTVPAPCRAARALRIKADTGSVDRVKGAVSVPGLGMLPAAASIVLSLLRPTSRSNARHEGEFKVGLLEPVRTGAWSPTWRRCCPGCG